jgi:hypothetical protein
MSINFSGCSMAVMLDAFMAIENVVYDSTDDL